jgi:hypothetical protein
MWDFFATVCVFRNLLDSIFPIRQRRDGWLDSVAGGVAPGGADQFGGERQSYYCPPRLIFEPAYQLLLRYVKTTR